MHSITQVRTPDELQNIYKELLKLKNNVMASFQSAPAYQAPAKTAKIDKSSFLDSARKNNHSTGGAQ